MEESNKAHEKIGVCKLCKEEKELILSHRIPKAVGAAIKRNSFTKKLRSTHNVNQSIQDLDKTYMLCSRCEELFGQRESLFMQKVLHPFRNKRIKEVEYDTWLYYFITSVSWRTLYEDASSKESFLENGFTKKQYSNLEKIEQRMRSFLSGETKVVSGIENHIIFLDESNEFHNHKIPYSMFCNATMGYVFGKSQNNTLYVFHILAGILIISILKMEKKEKYKNTFVKNNVGKIKQNQEVRSEVVNEIMSYVLDNIESAKAELSEKNVQSLLDKIQSDREGFLKSSSSINYRDQNNI